MNTRDIIIICITIIVLLSIGMFVMMNGGAQEKSILTMTNIPSLYEGDSLILKLTDENNTASEISAER